MMVLIVLLVIVGLIGLFFWATYNGLIRSKTRVEEAWSGIDVQLKRRHDLIPNLIETVKGYAAHEKELFTKVTEARSQAMGAGSIAQKAQAENALSSTLKSLFAVAENYPQLRASENFMQLQKELSDTESKIAYSRQFYNSNVMDFNVKIKVFPNVLIANQLGFKPAEFFAAEEADRAPVQVKF